MANVVEIVIKGTDQSVAPIKRAGENMANLGRSSKDLGRAMTEVGQVASALGDRHIANLSVQTGNLIAAGTALSSVFRNLTLRAGAVGIAIAGIGFAISKFVEMKEKAKEAENATKELKDMTEQLQMELQRSSKNETNAAIIAEQIRHRTRLEQISELLEKSENADAFYKALETENALHARNVENMRLTEHQKHLNSMQELDRAYNEANVSGYIESLNDINGKLLIHYTERRQFLDTYRQFWMESHRGMFSYAAEGVRTVAASLSDAVVDVAMNTKKASEAFRELGMSIGRMFLTWIVNRQIAWLAEKVLSAVGLGLAKAQAAAVSVIAGGVAAAWAPAATASLIATFGSSASAASLLIPAMAANQAAALGLSLAGGQAHGGASYIPEESTYLLSKGERVLSPRQNEDLTSFMEGSRGGSGGDLYIDGAKIGQVLWDMSRAGRLRISSRAIV